MHIFVSPVGRRSQHRHPLPPYRGLAGQRTPLLLSRGIRVKGKASVRTSLAHAQRQPRTWKIATMREISAAPEGQRIKRAFAHPQWPVACLQARRR